MELGSKNEGGFYHACAPASPHVNDPDHLIIIILLAMNWYLPLISAAEPKYPCYD
jgi:hypothetical protein